MPPHPMNYGYYPHPFMYPMMPAPYPINQQMMQEHMRAAQSFTSGESN